MAADEIENEETLEEMPENAEPPREKKKTVKQEIVSWITTIGSAVLIVLFVNTFIAEVVTVNGVSMLDTLHNKERLIATKIHGDYKRGDIVAFDTGKEHAYIKRVIGIGGDTIDINFDTSEVILNGEVLDEPYINEPTRERLDFEGPVTVPEGYLFVMGDNRNRSSDSRGLEMSFVDEKAVFGKAIFRIYPFDRIGVL